jgi:outer membrane protein
VYLEFKNTKSTQFALQVNTEPKQNLCQAVQAALDGETMKNIVLMSLLCTSVALAQVQNYSLENAYTALPNSLEWQSLDLTWQNAEQNLLSARANAGLNSNVGADANLTQPLSGSGSTNTTITVKANASLPVLPWAAQFDQVRSAERALARATLDRRDGRNTLDINVIQQYFNARIAGLDVENNQFAVQIAKQQLENAEKQFANGQLSKDSLENTRRNFENSQVSVLQTGQALELAKLQLWNTLGVRPNENTLSSTPEKRGTELSLEQALNNFEQRTDVQRAISRVQDAEDSLNIANRDRGIPSASISAGVSQQGGGSLNSSLNIGNGLLSVNGSYPVVGGNNSNPTNLTVGVSVSIPITAPSSDSKIESAKKSLESAKASLETTRRNARIDTQQKYNDLQLQIRRTDIAEKTLQNTKNSFETAKQRFALGSLTILDVQNTEQTMRQANRDFENQIAVQHISSMRLENAIGKVVVKRP